MNEESEVIVWVRRQWNDWRNAAYKIEDVSGYHWDDTSGGVQARANRAYLHAYVWCNEMVKGELAHSCRHGAGPHRIKVCIIKKLTNHIGMQSWRLQQARPKSGQRKSLNTLGNLGLL